MASNLVSGPTLESAKQRWLAQEPLTPEEQALIDQEWDRMKAQLGGGGGLSPYVGDWAPDQQRAPNVTPQWQGQDLSRMMEPLAGPAASPFGGTSPMLQPISSNVNPLMELLMQLVPGQNAPPGVQTGRTPQPYQQAPAPTPAPGSFTPRGGGQPVPVPQGFTPSERMPPSVLQQQSNGVGILPQPPVPQMKPAKDAFFARTNAPETFVRAPQFGEAALSTARSPMASLEFDPERTSLSRSMLGYNVGLYDKLSDLIVVGQYEDGSMAADPTTVTHESFHRGLFTLDKYIGGAAENTVLKRAIEDKKFNETLAYTMQLRLLGKEPSKELLKHFPDVGSKKSLEALDELEHMADQAITLRAAAEKARQPKTPDASANPFRQSASPAPSPQAAAQPWFPPQEGPSGGDQTPLPRPRPPGLADLVLEALLGRSAAAADIIQFPGARRSQDPLQRGTGLEPGGGFAPPSGKVTKLPPGSLSPAEERMLMRGYEGGPPTHKPKDFMGRRTQQLEREQREKSKKPSKPPK